MRPAASSRSISARASRWYSATLAVSVTSQMSSRWCGTPAALLGRELGGADVHAPVELHGVGVDHLAAEALGEGDAQVGLARRGRADDGDDPGRPAAGVRGGGGSWTPWFCGSSPHQSRKRGMRRGEYGFE